MPRERQLALSGPVQLRLTGLSAFRHAQTALRQPKRSDLAGLDPMGVLRSMQHKIHGQQHAYE